MDEIVAHMGDILKQQCFVPKRDVVEQDEVLVDLSHITHVRNNGQIEFSRQ